MKNNINLHAVLDSPHFLGIGPHLARKLISTFKSSGLLERMREHRYSDFTAIKGVSEIKASNLLAGYAYSSELLKLAIFLDNRGLSKPAAIILYRVWGDKALSLIQNNPYVLLATLPWKEVDHLGRELGSDYHPCRVIGAIEWCMYKDFEDNKHTCTNRETLRKMVRNLIACDEKTFQRGLRLSLQTKAIVEHLGMYQIPAAHWYERILEKFLANNPTTSLTQLQIEEWLDKSHHRSLTLEQRVAVKNAMQHRISAYCGRGGRGKTWTLTAITDGSKFLLKKKRIILAAISSKAVHRMQAETKHPPENCRTIATLIYTERTDDLRGAMIIIDEASMLSIVDAFLLVKKLQHDTHLVLLGDQNQIPSIGAGKLFYDIISKKVVPNIELTISQRHDKKTDEQLKMILNGTFPVFADYAEGCESGIYRRMVSTPNKNINPILLAEDEAINLYCDFLANEETAQIISPLRNIQFPGSSDSINTKAHRTIFGAKSQGNFCPATPVVWTKNAKVECGASLSNGSVGYVHKICGQDSQYYLSVAFDDEGVVDLKWHEANEFLEYSYCLSVHRAQGSEWDNVIIVLPRSERMIDRNMVYTALSRCKKRSIVLYDNHEFIKHKVEEPPAHERRRSLFLQSK